MTTDAAYFSRLYAASDDPWGFRSRWYEARKFALTLAALSRQRYRRAFDAGCSNGELTRGLAGRCDALHACDLSPRAVALARERLDDLPQVEVRQRELPREFPEGRFDLIVISELGYFLPRCDLNRLVTLSIGALEADGEIVLCHWRRRIADAPQDGAAVHACFAQAAGGTLCRRSVVDDTDFLLEVWAPPSTPWVAEREGLR